MTDEAQIYWFEFFVSFGEERIIERCVDLQFEIW